MQQKDNKNKLIKDEFNLSKYDSNQPVPTIVVDYRNQNQIFLSAETITTFHSAP